MAVDKIHVYGTPFFIQADLPIDSDKPSTKFRQLMIAQDTGSAINGPARADLYWGAGDAAGRIAGRIRQQGQFVMLLPRELDMVEAGKHTPPATAGAGAEAAPVRPPAAKSTNKPAGKPALAVIGPGRRQKQRLARGNEKVELRIGLHGQAQSEAHGALPGVLARAQTE